MPRPLTLAFIADPNSVHTRRWLGWFAGEGHSVHLLVGESDMIHAGLPDGISLHRYRRFGSFRIPLASSLQGRRALRACLRAINPDVLHAHYLTRYGWQARLSGFHPYVVSPWGSDLYVTPRHSMRARIWGRITLRGADLVTVVSEEMRQTVQEFGVVNERIALVSFGIDLERFVPAAGGESALPPEMQGRRIVFSPRAIRPVYRQDVVIRAFERLPADTLLVMTARNADAHELRAIEARVRTSDLSNRVLIHDGLDDARMLALFQEAEVVVSVPESDGVPISIGEAMACGTPVVATDLAGPRDLLGDHRGWLVPVGDIEATAAALRSTLDIPKAQRVTLRVDLRDAVTQRMDRTANMRRMEELYQSLPGVLAERVGVRV